ncbi:Uncharacterized protein BM_BM12849 [Brugia malayi]|uniref:Bm12849, isoform c n=1 Tax=Brugia malayi TaxID=6279 RepID=A0A1U7F2J6_BRUMA|nr:Uncharacterized protein BM_BM12849 [Brugia malayi]CDQ02157.1 Bm12849, isoform c [Brugia malayi]VIO96236.1 Uncharacterized protein BM_BM12849 [Brugia malayi]
MHFQLSNNIRAIITSYQQADIYRYVSVTE